MAQGQIGSGMIGIGVSGVEPKQTSGLAQDIGNLFGSVAKGVETYNTVGTTAAKIQFQEDKRVVNEQLIMVKKDLTDATYANDSDKIRELGAKMEGLTADIVAKSDSFKNHKAAYDEYNSSALDYATTVRSTYTPFMYEAQKQAIKTNTDADNKAKNETSSVAGISVADTEVDKQVDLSVPRGIKKEDISSDAFKTNHSAITGNISKNIDNVIASYGLFVPDKETGVKGYSFEAEKAMVEKEYGGRYSIDTTTGQVTSTSKYATEEEIYKVSSLLGHLRATVINDQGEPKNPRADALHSTATDVVTAYEKNGADPRNNKQIQEYMSIPDSAMSSAQIYTRKVFIEKYNIASDISSDVKNVVNSWITTADQTSLAVASANGYGGLTGTQIKSEIARRGELLNATVNQAILSGSGNLEDLYGEAYIKAGVLGVTLDATTKSSSVASGSIQAISANQTESMLRIERKKISIGTIEGGAYKTPAEAKFRTIAINEKLQAIDYERKRLESLGLNKAQIDSKLQTTINGLNAKGITVYTENYQANKAKIEEVKATHLGNAWYNSGTPLTLTSAQKIYIAEAAASSGKKFGSPEEAGAWVKDNMYRQSEFYGVAQFVPNGISDKGFESIRKSVFNSLKIPLNNTTSKYQIMMSPELKNGVTYVVPTVYIDNQKPVTSSKAYDISKLSLIIDEKSFGINTETKVTLPTKLSSPEYEEKLRKNLIKYIPTATNKKPTGGI